MIKKDQFMATMGVEIAGFQRVREILDETRHISAYVSDDGETLAIGFDGTIGNVFPPSKDWLENLRAWKKSFSIGTENYRAMAGFVEEYRSVRESVLGLVHVYCPRKIIVTGFSQGGAHAALAWRDMIYWYPSLDIHGTVFASPRVYDERGSLEFDMKLTPNHTFERVNLWGDPAPAFPPSWMGFRHVGKNKMIGKFRLIPSPKVHSGLNYINTLGDY
jgi:hypothetical protein